MTDDYGYPEYVPVAKKRARAAKKLRELKKKRPDIQPVVIEGRSIARTWWGKSWNQNLERYADYSYRIERGRSYVRHGAVLDLQIEPGKVHALVQGSQSRPYKVEISIKALGKSTWERIRKTAEGQLDSLGELLAGKFPKALQESFFEKDRGLFPSPKEIGFDCSCPDYASMCKHVAASLYGVGARLDEDPSLFFKLRDIQMDDLITRAVESTSQSLLEKAETRSARVLDDADLTDVFGIKLEDAVDFERRGAKHPDQRAAEPPKRTRNRKKAVKSSTTESAKPAAPRKSPAKPEKRRTAPATGKGATLVDIVILAIPKRQKAMGVTDICAQADLSEKQVRNALARAVVQGKLKSPERGMYTRS